MSHAMLQEPQIYLRLVLIFHCSLLSSPKGKRRWRQPDDDPSDQCHCHKFKRKGQSGFMFHLGHHNCICFFSWKNKWKMDKYFCFLICYAPRNKKSVEDFFRKYYHFIIARITPQTKSVCRDIKDECMVLVAKSEYKKSLTIPKG